MLLCAALALVAFSAYQAHWRPDEGHYPYPVHMDEYLHWGYARAVQVSGEVAPADPFGADPLVKDRPEAAEEPLSSYPTEIHERGFHGYLAVLQGVTGIPWLPLIEFLPLAVWLFTALVAYALAQRWDAGVAVVLWMAAIPTTLRFLGPGFVVPITFSLPFVLLALLASTHGGGRGAWACVAILAAAAWPIHAMGALLLTFCVGVALLAQERAGRLVYAAAVLFPFLLAWPYYVPQLSSLRFSPDLPIATEAVRIGMLPVLLFAAVGAYYGVVRGRPRERAVALALALTLVGAVTVIVHRHMFGWDLLRLYDRTVTTFGLFAALLAGIGVRGIARGLAGATGRLRWPQWRRPALALAVALLIAIQGAAVATAVRDNVRQPYYEVLTDARYSLYLEAAALYGGREGRALVDGVDTMAWTAITGIPTAYVQYPSSGDPPPEIKRFFEDGSRDTAFLVQHGVTLVVTGREVKNPDLHPSLPTIYELDERMVARLAASGAR